MVFISIQLKTIIKQFAKNLLSRVLYLYPLLQYKFELSINILSHLSFSIVAATLRHLLSSILGLAHTSR